MSISTRLDDLNIWANKISKNPDLEQVASLKNATEQLRNFGPSKSELEKISALAARIAELEETVRIMQISRNDLEERKIGAPVQRDLIIANINQYRGANTVSTCTSCAAAFLKILTEEERPLDETLIRDAIQQGQRAHETVSRALPRGPNANYAAGEVIERGNLNLRKINKNTISMRPTSRQTQTQHYLQNIISPLTNVQNQRSGYTLAILTKAPYSSSVAYRQRTKDYVYFDSHGEPATNNQALIRIFKTPEALCNYLTQKFGFFEDFPDVDYDLETDQDNPNLYELTIVESEQIAQPAGRREQIFPVDEPAHLAPACLRDRCTIL